MADERSSKTSRKVSERSGKAKQETVGVVLSDHQKQVAGILQGLSGLSRSDVIRQLIDIALGNKMRHEALIDMVMPRSDLQERLLEAVRAQVTDPEWGAEGLAPSTFVRRIISIQVAGFSIREPGMRFEGFITFSADVDDGGVKRNKTFHYLFDAMLKPEGELTFDLGPHSDPVELSSITPITF